MLFAFLTIWEFRQALKRACASQSRIGLSFLNESEGDLVTASINHVGIATFTYDVYAEDEVTWLCSNTAAINTICAINHSHTGRERDRLMALESADERFKFENCIPFDDRESKLDEDGDEPDYDADDNEEYGQHL